jgi:hypothetical protein
MFVFDMVVLIPPKTMGFYVFWSLWVTYTIIIFQSIRSKKRLLINLPAIKKRNLINKNKKRAKKNGKKG